MLRSDLTKQAEEKMKEAQTVYELFEEADADSSGTISKEEFINFEASIGVTSEAEALELFAQVDTDKNGENLTWAANES